MIHKRSTRLITFRKLRTPFYNMVCRGYKVIIIFSQFMVG